MYFSSSMLCYQKLLDGCGYARAEDLFRNVAGVLHDIYISEVLGVTLSWQSVHSSFQHSTLLNVGTKGGKWNFYFSSAVKLRILNGSWGCIPVCLKASLGPSDVFSDCEVHGFASHGNSHQLKQQLSCLLPGIICLFYRNGCDSNNWRKTLVEMDLLIKALTYLIKKTPTTYLLIFQD